MSVGSLGLKRTVSTACLRPTDAISLKYVPPPSARNFAVSSFAPIPAARPWARPSAPETAAHTAATTTSLPSLIPISVSAPRSAGRTLVDRLQPVENRVQETIGAEPDRIVG